MNRAARGPRALNAWLLQAMLGLAGAAALGQAAAAQQARRPAPARMAPGQASPLPAPAPAEVPAEPQRTTASFGDWVLRCEHPDQAGRQCELAQAVTARGQTVAQFAIGRPQRTEVLQMTVLVPSNVMFAALPRLTAATAGGEVPALEFTWRRCLPGGCLATAALRDDSVQRLRTQTEPARLLFQDGMGQNAALPFSPHGLTQGLAALLRTEAR